MHQVKLLVHLKPKLVVKLVGVPVPRKRLVEILVVDVSERNGLFKFVVKLHVFDLWLVRLNVKTYKDVSA